MKIAMNIGNAKGGSYIVGGEGTSVRLAINDALKYYEETWRAKKRPSLNKLAKMQTFTRIEIRIESTNASDEPTEVD